MTNLLRDFGAAVRALARTPLLTSVVIGSLAIGVGVNTVVFSWVQARLLRPFPGVTAGVGFYGVEPVTRTRQYTGASWLEYQDLRRSLTAFADLIASRATPLYVGEPGRVERTSGVLVSPNYFDGLGLRPAAGRFFLPAEVEGAGEQVAVISHGLWERLFQGAPEALGESIRVNGRRLTIVGVAPREFLGTVTGMYFDVWLPAVIAPLVLNGSSELTDRGARGYLMLGRLKRGVTFDRAQSEVDAVMRDLSRDFPQTSADMTAEVTPAWNLPRGPARTLNAAVGILQGVMLLVLLAVCGNTANLALARSSARYREVGVRLAIGASRGSIIRLLLTETVLMSSIGAALGAIMATWGTNALRVVPLTGIPLRLDTSVDRWGLLVAISLGLLAGFIIGAAPALHLARINPQVAFRSGMKTATRSRFRDALMATQVCLALMVLVATGISLASYLQAKNADPGFRAEGVLLAAYDLSGRPRTPQTTRVFNAALLERVSSLTGVEAAAIASSVPLDFHGLPTRIFTLEGRPRTEAGGDQATTNTVTSGYFDVMGIEFVAGSDFAPLARPDVPPQAIVNEAFVETFVGDGEAIGRRVTARGRNYTIVGVVRNSIINTFGEPPTPMLYFSYRDASFASGEVHVRTQPGQEQALGQQLRQTVRDLDAEVPLFNVRTMSDHVGSNLFLRTVPARMFAVIGPLLLALAAMGIYAVVAYNASQRRVEVGVRLALGATPPQIVRQFLRETLSVTAIGAAIGLAASLAGAKRLVPDSAALSICIVVTIVLALVTVAACWWPARRASLLAPVDALRPN